MAQLAPSLPNKTKNASDIIIDPTKPRGPVFEENENDPKSLSKSLSMPFMPNSPSQATLMIEPEKTEAPSSVFGFFRRKSKSNSKAEQPERVSPIKSFFGAIMGGNRVRGDEKAIDLDEAIKRLLDVANGNYPPETSVSSQGGKEPLCFEATEVTYLVRRARELVLSQPVMLELPAPINIAGDIHGQYEDLIRWFELCGYPSETKSYLFLGDYVDRGKKSLETMLLLICFKLKFPTKFHLLRGNHESATVTRVYGFFDECKRRLNVRLWKNFVDFFDCLPLCAVVAGKLFCVHGGLSPSLTKLSKVLDISRPVEVPEAGPITDLLWADPGESIHLDFEENDRGVSFRFNKNALETFLKANKLELVVRAHMVVNDGYLFWNRKKLVTVFSAPNYCGQMDNDGAIMEVGADLMCKFIILRPAEGKKGFVTAMSGDLLQDLPTPREPELQVQPVPERVNQTPSQDDSKPRNRRASQDASMPRNRRSSQDGSDDMIVKNRGRETPEEIPNRVSKGIRTSSQDGSDDLNSSKNRSRETPEESPNRASRGRRSSIQMTPEELTSPSQGFKRSSTSNASLETIAAVPEQNNQRRRPSMGTPDQSINQLTISGQRSSLVGQQPLPPIRKASTVDSSILISDSASQSLLSPSSQPDILSSSLRRSPRPSEIAAIPETESSGNHLP